MDLGLKMVAQTGLQGAVLARLEEVEGRGGGYRATDDAVGQPKNEG
jgi:hypothetical protein